MSKSGSEQIKGPMPGRKSEIVTYPINRGADGNELKQIPKPLKKSKPAGDAGESPGKGKYFGTP